MEMPQKIVSVSSDDLIRNSPFTIKKWVDLYSDELKMMVNDHKAIHTMIRSMIKDNHVYVDAHGRIWSYSFGSYSPVHIEYGKNKYGIRLIKAASNLK